jgi:transposase
VPQGHYKTTTVTAALRTSGLIATTLFDGTTNGARFRTYVTDTLVPVLKPGETVILDNLQSHKVVGVREAIEAAARGSPTSRPTRPTSTRSSRPSQSSRRCCAPPLP